MLSDAVEDFAHCVGALVDVGTGGSCDGGPVSAVGLLADECQLSLERPGCILSESFVDLCGCGGLCE